MKKQLLVAGAVAIGSLGIAGSAIAANSPDTKKDEFASKLATRFNLNKDEVTKFMDEQREAHMAEREAKVKEALKAAGFSDQQIADLQAKKKEQRGAMESWREANPDATRDQTKAQRDKEKTEFESWAKEKGIDLTKVREALKDIMPKGMGPGRHMDDGSGSKDGQPS